jgi:large subunit ribosomal protein L3
MMKNLIGRKMGMGQIFSEEGKAVPVTIIEAGPCLVTQIKTREKEGYNAVQLGFEEVQEDRLNKPRTGHLKSKGVKPLRHLSEVRVDDPGRYELGQEIKVDVFSKGDRADVSGISKGKGFAGVIKRHGFSGGPASHGSHFHRAPGSVGACATPAKVFKGKKLPGHMGHETVTVLSLEIVDIKPDLNLLLVKGAVPGPRGGLVHIREAVKGNKGKRRAGIIEM